MLAVDRQNATDNLPKCSKDRAGRMAYLGKRPFPETPHLSYNKEQLFEKRMDKGILLS